MTAERGYGKTEGLAEEAKAEREIIRAQPLSHHRFFSNFGKIKTNEVVLVKTTEEEIKIALTHKYDVRTVNALKKINISRKKYLEEIVDGRTKQARRAAYLAHSEYQQISYNPLRMIPGVRESRPDNDYNDAIIVDTACQAKKELFESLFLFTADVGVSRRCEEVGLPHFFFKVPIESYSICCNNHHFCELIYGLARVFGVITVNSVVVFGEFHDKQQVQSDQILVEIANEKLFSEVEKHLKICRGLLNLNIKE